ncbi:MAG: alpha/beta hydrolase [Alphaproteobacteria bacterium]|nr:alpha/beta hydrolase [Alphaproteobacteria bacterium]
MTFSACTPVVQPNASEITQPSLTGNAFMARDRVSLPMRSWLPENGPPKAIILALHGFNDYSNAFDAPGRYLAKHGIAVYAYDQRGFGQAPDHGLWPGTENLVNDLKDAAKIIQTRHPGIPFYLLGESMGGAVVMAATTRPAPPRFDGIILSAPAVWGRDTMPMSYRISLFLTAHTMPWLTLSGRGLHIMASDNIEMLRGLFRDPLIIKKTRVDAIFGLANLMDEAFFATARVPGPLLLLYGASDEVVPRKAMARALRTLPNSDAIPRTVAIYGKGYHMLLRDLNAAIPLGDIVAWITAPGAPLPSGADHQKLTENYGSS